jgi:hypothetical protein
MVTFIDRAGHVTSAISPVEIGLSYCQKNASPNVASCIKGLSIIASPIDYVIQVAVTPIWIIYDDLRSNSTLLDWLFTPLRLPGKILLGTALSVITQFLEGMRRIEDIYNSSDSNELHHEYKEKWTWLTKSQEQMNANATNQPAIQVFADVNSTDISEQIERVITPTLRARHYTHLYLRRADSGAPPMLFAITDGVFADHPMPNAGLSSFILIFIRSWERETRAELSFDLIREMQHSTSQHVTEERTGLIYGFREYENLRLYDILPLRVLDKLQQLPIYE